MTISWHLPSGETGEVTAFANNILSVVSPRAFAPGAPTSFSVAEISLRGKSLGSKRRQDGNYEVRFRLISLERAQREQLQQLFQRA